MSSSSDSEEIDTVRYVSGRGQDALAFLRDVELGVHATGKNVNEARIMDTAIQKSDKRVREKLNQWRKDGCPVKGPDGAIIATVDDLDWNPVSPFKWLDHEGSSWAYQAGGSTSYVVSYGSFICSNI